MPKRADPELKSDKGIYHSKLKANDKYISEKTEQVLFRVPTGMKKQIQDYVDTLPEYEVKGKPHHSVNAWLLDLVKNEMNINKS